MDYVGAGMPQDSSTDKGVRTGRLQGSSTVASAKYIGLLDL